MLNQVFINEVGIYPFISEAEMFDFVSFNKGILVAINADKILHATDQTKGIINKNVGYCDGIGAVLALKKKGFKDVAKIAGYEFWLKIIDKYCHKKTFYIIGATQEVIELTVGKLKLDYPDIQILNYRNGYIRSDEERSALIADVVLKKPDVVFVAMGSPKQELLMDEMNRVHPAIYQGLGGSFDVYTGTVKRIPEWWKKHNLEGAYRLINQPYKLNRFVKALPFWWNLFIGKY